METPRPSRHLQVVRAQPKCDHDYMCYEDPRTREPKHVHCKKCNTVWKVVPDDSPRA